MAQPTTTSAKHCQHKQNLIAQHSQAYNAHRRQLITEMSHCANYPVGQIQQQFVAIQQEMARIRAE